MHIGTRPGEKQRKGATPESPPRKREGDFGKNRALGRGKIFHDAKEKCTRGKP